MNLTAIQVTTVIKNKKIIVVKQKMMENHQFSIGIYMFTFGPLIILTLRIYIFTHHKPGYNKKRTEIYLTSSKYKQSSDKLKATLTACHQNKILILLQRR